MPKGPLGRKSARQGIARKAPTRFVKSATNMLESVMSTSPLSNPKTGAGAAMTSAMGTSAKGTKAFQKAHDSAKAAGKTEFVWGGKKYKVK
jgi:hypothetical protein